MIVYIAPLPIFFAFRYMSFFSIAQERTVCTSRLFNVYIDLLYNGTYFAGKVAESPPLLVFLGIRFVCLFVSPLGTMGLNLLGYDSHLLQRFHLACGHEGSSHLSPVLVFLRFFIAMQVQHSYTSSSSGWILLVHVLTLSTAEARKQILVLTRIEYTTSALVGVRGYLLDHSGKELLLLSHTFSVWSL